MQVLIADFFFVCAALAWLVAGAGANTFLSNSVRTARHSAAAVAISCKLSVSQNLMHGAMIRCLKDPPHDRKISATKGLLCTT